MPVDAQDRTDVLDVLARFAHGIDGRRWDLYRSVFTDDVAVDYSSYRTGSVGTMSADEWVDRARRLVPGAGRVAARPVQRLDAGTGRRDHGPYDDAR